jgi:hypothetical protein
VIRVGGRLGPTCVSAFPGMVCESRGGETVLRGWLLDRSALFGVLGVVEALGLELLEVRLVGEGGESPDCGDGGSPGGV